MDVQLRDQQARTVARARERIDESRVFGGLNLNFVAVNLAFEAEKMGDNVSLSAKVGWRF